MPGLGGTNAYRSAMPSMLKIMSLANQGKYNVERDKEVIKKMMDENAGNELALDGYGRMYVQNEDGEIKKIKISEFDPEKYAPLSNSQLLYHREQNPKLAFDNSAFEDLRNIVGMTSVIKEVDRIVKEFGTQEESRYLSKDAAQAFLDINSPDGLYKLTQKVPSKGLKEAWKAVWDQLPTNMQNVLKARAAISGDDDPKKFIADIVFRNTSSTENIDYDTTASKAAGFNVGGSGSGSEKTTKDTYPERLVSGSGLDPEQWINIMPSNTGITLTAYSQNAGPVMKDGNRFNNSNLQVMLSHADGIGGIVDAQSITFGEDLINSSEFKNLMVDTTVNMKRVWLPIRYTEDGRITPNFEAQQKLEQAQEYVSSQNGQISDAWIEQWLSENLPNAKWNKDTKTIEFDKQTMRPFLVVHGIAARNRVSFNSDSNYLHHLSNNEGKQLKDEYERIVGQESVVGKIEKVKGEGAARWKYYSGNIYMPISGPTVGAFIYNDQYFPQETYTNITQKARNSEARDRIRTNFE